MSRGEVGRNDPCPCGSGKKYKYCCLRKDQQRRRQRRTSLSPPSPNEGPVLSLLRQVEQRTRQLGRVPGEEARELKRQGEELVRMARLFASQEAIEVAMETLDQHRDVFHEMMQDPAEAAKRALELFSEDRFEPLRVSVEELEQAFELVGYPAPGPFGMGQADVDVLFEAATHLAGDERERTLVAQALLAELSDLVAAERFEDAWLVQHSVGRLLEEPDKPNPFYFAMAQLAYEEMELALPKKYRDVAEELGIDREKLHAADIDQVEAMVEGLNADPDKKARVERFLASEPMLMHQTEEQMMREVMRSLQLLERDDSECLLLSLEELGPWLVELAELGRTVPGHQEVLESGAAPDEDVAEAVREAVFELTLEMSPVVFTEQRREQLVEDLHDYRDRLRGAGEREAARHAGLAIDLVEWGLPPAEDPFLLATCYASLRRVIRSLPETPASPDGTDQSPSRSEGTAERQVG